MRLVDPVLTGIVATVAAVASAQPAGSSVSNSSSTPPMLAPPNSSDEGFARTTSCTTPLDAFGKWWYNTRSDGPYYCYGNDILARWSMLNSYRSGGTINVHWKYTDDPHDLECLNGWTYYAEDGKKIITLVSGSITLAQDTRSWCALPVYRSGGVEGNQWDWCRCWNKP